MHSLQMATPEYVLLDGNQRVGPLLTAPHSGPAWVVIFGFSGKQAYDIFCINSHKNLTPYPLVKVFLREQIAEIVNGVKLVAIDPVSPLEAQLNASTLEEVLAAHEKKLPRVNIAYRLIMSNDLNRFEIQKAPITIG